MCGIRSTTSDPDQHCCGSPQGRYFASGVGCRRNLCKPARMIPLFHRQSPSTWPATQRASASPPQCCHCMFRGAHSEDQAPPRLPRRRSPTSRADRVAWRSHWRGERRPALRRQSACHRHQQLAVVGAVAQRTEAAGGQGTSKAVMPTRYDLVDGASVDVVFAGHAIIHSKYVCV